MEWCLDKFLLLDIGGEGRYAKAWNLNPSPVKTIGPQRGAPIARHIAGRAEAIPLPDGSVRWILVERTPLREVALREIARVIMPGGMIVLRHVASTKFDRHRTAREVLPGRVSERVIRLRGQTVQETRFHLGDPPDHFPKRGGGHLVASSICPQKSPRLHSLVVAAGWLIPYTLRRVAFATR